MRNLAFTFNFSLSTCNYVMYGDELPNKYFTTSSRRQGAFKYNINKREKS